MTMLSRYTLQFCLMSCLFFSGEQVAAKTASGSEHIDQLIHEAEQLELAGHYADALKAADIVLALAKDKKEPLSEARAMSIKARTLDDLGRFEESWPLHDAAVAFAQTTGKADDPRIFAISRRRLESLVNGGKPDVALEPSIALAKTVEAQLGPKHPQTVAALVQQAYALDAVGRYGDARIVHERALALAREVNGASSLSALEELNNMAMNYYFTGRMDEATAMFSDAVIGIEKLYGDEHPWVIAGRNNLAAVYSELGRLPEAISIFEKAYEVDARTLGKDHPDTLLRLANLGQVLAQAGENARAVEILRDAVTRMETHELGKSPMAITARYNLAGVLGELHRIAEARPLYHQALDQQIALVGAREYVTMRMYGTIAKFERDNGNPAEARRLLDVLVANAEAARLEGDLAPENRQALFARWVQGYKVAAQLAAEQNDTDEALRLAELSKARTLLESSAMLAANELALPDAVAREKVASMETHIRELDVKISAESDLQARVALDSKKGIAVREYAVYRRELALANPRYAALSEVRIVGREEGARLLAGDTRFVEFLMVDASTALVLVLGHDGKLQKRVLDLGPGFANTVLAYRRLIAAPGGWRDLLADGLRIYAHADGSFILSDAKPNANETTVTDPAPIASKLGALLLESLQTELGASGALIISPDGVLATLPFEALPFAGKPLVANRDVTYVQSLSMLALLDARARSQDTTSKPRLLAVGGAEYATKDTVSAASNAVVVRGAVRRSAIERELADDPGKALEALRGTWEPLPGSASEVARVSAVFAKSAEVLTGAKASEAQLRTLNLNGQLSEFRYLLFSTHGYLSTQNPSLSSVVLSQRDLPKGTDGYITAIEWPAYRLHSQLLVLSACETGLGDNVQGEGVMGLPYALYVAGNRDSVLSLWSVVDRSTEEFMVRFFTRIKQGERPSAALAAVKREFMDSKEFAAPVYWAPFVLYGGI